MESFPYPVDQMNQLQLVAFIKNLLNYQGGMKAYIKGNLSESLPQKVPLTSEQSLKNVGGEDIFNKIMKSVLHNCSTEIRVVNNQNGSVSLVMDDAVVTFESRQNTQYATPGSACTSTEPLLSSVLFNASSTRDVQHSEETVPILDRVGFKCLHCEQCFSRKNLLVRHQRFYCEAHVVDCKQNPYRTRLSNLPVHQNGREEVVMVKPRKRQKLIVEKVTFPAKGLYVKSLGLVPQSVAAKIHSNSANKKVSCDVIELGDENVPPKTPTTPLGRKSLISLFRDASPPGCNKLSSGKEIRTEKCSFLEYSDEDADSVSSRESTKTDEYSDGYQPRRVMSLFNIDITSLLGARVRKHINARYDTIDNGSLRLNNNYESYCRTPTKAKVSGRLRNRGKEFQVTFKKSKRTVPKFCHLYKFSRAQQREFCRLIETGLNKRSRALKKQMAKCRVVLEHLSEKDIVRYCSWYVSSRKATHRRREYKSSENSVQCNKISNTMERKSAVVKSDDCYVVPHFVNQSKHDFDDTAPVNNLDLTPPISPQEEFTSQVDDDDIIILDELSQPESNVEKPSIEQCLHRQRRKSPIIPRKWIDDGDSKLDDVISISSADSDDELIIAHPKGLHRNNSFSTVESDTCMSHRVKEQLRPSALLFKCHICSEQIICEENATIFIKQHFDDVHDVHNIELIEHLDASGQKVFSIIEVSNEVGPVNGTKGCSKRLRYPLASKNVCNENNLPTNETKRLAVGQQKSSCKALSKSHGKMDKDDLGDGVRTGRIKKRRKTKPSASKKTNSITAAFGNSAKQLVFGKTGSDGKKKSASQKPAVKKTKTAMARSALPHPANKHKASRCFRKR